MTYSISYECKRLSGSLVPAVAEKSGNKRLAGHDEYV